MACPMNSFERQGLTIHMHKFKKSRCATISPTSCITNNPGQPLCFLLISFWIFAWAFFFYSF